MAQVNFPKSYDWPNQGFAEVSKRVTKALQDPNTYATQLIGWLRKSPRIWSLDALARNVIYLMYMHELTKYILEAGGEVAAPVPASK